MADDIVAKKGEQLLKCISEGVAAGFSQKEMSDPLLLVHLAAWKIKVLPILQKAQESFAKSGYDNSWDLEVPGELLKLMENDRNDSESSAVRAYIASYAYFSLASPDCMGKTPLVRFSDLNVKHRTDTLASVDEVRLLDDELRFDCLSLGNKNF